MKSSSHSPMPHPTSSRAAASGNTTYSPSVPISVYRELAAELQATKAMLESATTQNQSLQQQNQQLRQEADRLIQQAMKLQQILHPHTLQAAPAPSQADFLAEPMHTGQYGDRSPVLPNPQPEDLFTEQTVVSSSSAKPKPPKDMSGLWLTLVVIGVIVTAFGLGFLVVRPFLSNNNR